MLALYRHTDQQRKIKTQRDKQRKREGGQGGGGGGGRIEKCLIVSEHPSNKQNVFKEPACSDGFTCYHTAIKAADKTGYLTQSA